MGRTLAIDIGGTGLKALVLDDSGTTVTDRVRVETPRPATPEALLPAIVELVKPLGGFDRISVGFPGVVVEGVTRTAPNLHEEWEDFDLAHALTDKLGKPCRVLNDAGVQGYAVIHGKGVEMLLTLGTGMGCALYHDGRYVPNIELAHHPLHGKKTYEEWIGVKALKKIGKKKWNKRVHTVIETVLPIFNPDRLFIGGGNAKHLKIDLPPNVEIVPNLAGLIGGIALWRDAPSPTAQPAIKAVQRAAATSPRDAVVDK